MFEEDKRDVNLADVGDVVSNFTGLASTDPDVQKLVGDISLGLKTNPALRKGGITVELIKQEVARLMTKEMIDRADRTKRAQIDAYKAKTSANIFDSASSALDGLMRFAEAGGGTGGRQYREISSMD